MKSVLHSFIQQFIVTGCSVMGFEIFFANFETFFRFPFLNDFLGYNLFFSGKLIVSRMLDRFLVMYGLQSFNAVLTKARELLIF